MSMSGLDISQYGLAEISDIMQIIFADIILSGDNALVIGMAVAPLAWRWRQSCEFYLRLSRHNCLRSKGFC